MATGRQATEQQATEQQRATIGLAIKDLGFVGGLFMALVGAPSVITLLQAVLTDFTLSSLVQWLIDGYNGILRVLALGLDPLLIQFLLAVRDAFEVDIALQPHWRPLFVLALIFISANTRTIWGDGYKGPAALNALFCATFALLACLIAGVVPNDAAPWVHGLVAAQFVFLIFLGLFIAYAIAAVVFAFSEPYRQPLWRYLMRGALLAGGAFAIAYGLAVSGAPVERPGLTAAFGGMFLYGAYWLTYGLTQNVFPEVRFGLRMVGGFLFALLIVAVDALLR